MKAKNSSIKTAFSGVPTAGRTKDGQGAFVPAVKKGKSKGKRK